MSAEKDTTTGFQKTEAVLKRNVSWETEGCQNTDAAFKISVSWEPAEYRHGL
jgi:hypothetical protein